MKDGRVKVVDVDRILDHVVAKIVGAAEVMPGLMPPPAIQTVNARG